jgi:FkbM family methyltransferase
LFNLSADDFFVDVGAYDGDTLRQFLALQGESFRRVLALEPDPDNLSQLQAFLSSLPDSLRSKIEARSFAAGSQSCILRFAAGGGTGSAVSAQGSVEVECVRLDDLLGGLRPTYIKMDIEGAEPDAIAGCERILRDDRPVLAACVYHAQDHLWTIPLAIHKFAPDYRLFIRPHATECRETVCYAVPPERLTSKSLTP